MKPHMRPVEPYNDEDEGDCMMTLEDFARAVRFGCYTDDDGCGDFATATEVSEIRVDLSDLARGGAKTPPWATHVCWYNK